MNIRKIYMLFLGLIFAVVGLNIYLANTYEDATRRLSIVPQFTLTDMHGKTVTLNDYKGKRVLISFGYTNCIDICPVTLATLSNILYDIQEQNPDSKHDYQALFITVDPERDTPAVLKNYITDTFHPNITGLTGTVDQIKHATESFNITFEKYGQTNDGHYSMVHSVYIFAIDEDGDYKTYFAHTAPPKTSLKILKKHFKGF